jgi:hypothetical protein
MAERRVLSLGDGPILLLEKIDPADIKVGMVVHHVEHYPYGVVLQFTGPISSVGRLPDGRLFALMRGMPFEEIKRIPSWTEDYRVVD